MTRLVIGVAPVAVATAVAVPAIAVASTCLASNVANDRVVDVRDAELRGVGTERGRGRRRMTKAGAISTSWWSWIAFHVVWQQSAERCGAITRGACRTLAHFAPRLSRPRSSVPA